MTVMSRKLTIVAGLAVLVVLGGMSWVVSSDRREDEPKKARTTSFGRTVADEVSVRKHGYYGIDFVRCGSCRIENRKIGPLTIGGLKVLVLKDLQVVLPTDGRSDANPSEKGMTAMELADRLGVTEGLMGARDVPFKFSGLRIEGLRIATLDAATNVCPRLVAASGEAERDGLHLYGCQIVRDGATNAVGRAVLKVSPDLRLVWSSGEMML